MRLTVTRLIALLLALVMCVGVMPVSAFAEGEEEPAATELTEPANQGGEGEDGEPAGEAANDEESDPSVLTEEVKGENNGEEQTRGTTDGFDDERVVTDEGLRIERLSASFHRGAEWNGKHWVWTPLNSSSGHDFTYKITYSFGSTEPFYPGEIEIIIPKYIIRNINGEYSNDYNMSIPDKDAEGLSEANIYVYEDLGDRIRIFNRVEAIPTQKGFFEVSYVTSEETWEYWDYDSENPIGSDKFQVSLYLEQVGAKKEAAAEADPVYIDTYAYITEVSKEYPHLYESWQGNWGPEPEDSNEYYYLTWEIHTNIEATQTYNFSVEDVFAEDYIDCEVYKYRMMGATEYSDNNTVKNLKREFRGIHRIDMVLTRHKKSTYDQYLTAEVTDTYISGGYTLNNLVRCTVDPWCQVDEDSILEATRAWSHKRHDYIYPTGHFFSLKYGLKYGEIQFAGDHVVKTPGRVHYSEDISSYRLSEFADGQDDENNEVTELSDLCYYSFFRGFPYPWTWCYDGDGNAPDWRSEEGRYYFGKKPVHYSYTDNKLILHTMDDEDGINLEAGDYRIDKIIFDYSMYLGKYDTTEKCFVSGEKTFSEITLFVQLDGAEEWVEVAKLTQSELTESEYIEPDWVVSREDIISSASGPYLYFSHENGDVTGYRVDTENAFFYTIIYTIPSITLLRSSEKVLNYAKAAIDSDEKKMYLENFSEDVVTDWNGNIIFTKTDNIGVDYILGIKKEGEISKQLIGNKNDVVNSCYTVTWQGSMRETYKDGDGIPVYVEQSSGKFFDLIPAGGEFVYGSVQAFADGKAVSEGNFVVKTTPYYNKTGQTLLEVDFLIPGDEYSFIYQTNHSWECIHDYGPITHNLLAYETGNAAIGEGFFNDGGNLTGEDKELMSGLDSTDAKRFLYTTRDHEISIITAGSLGLYKRVKNERETLYGQETTVFGDMNYSYRIRFATDEETEARHLIIYDSLENFVGEGNHSLWRGYYTGIDLSIPISLGISPVLYYSTVPELEIEANESLDSGAWIKASEYEGELKDVKAIAVDMWHDTEGNEFVLTNNTQVSMTIFMRAPAALDLASKDDAAYNNVYLHNQVKEYGYENWDEDRESLEHQDYVKVLYRSVGSFILKKVDSTNEDKVIPGIYFQLSGTSFYGNNVDMIVPTNTRGEISFENIERGEYTLQEIKGSVDYLLDDSVYTVRIDYKGKVYISIGGVESEVTGPFVVKNSPRVHGDLEFYKRGYIDGSQETIPLVGVTFNLKGTSEYGNSLNMFRTSIDGGKVVFENIEWGEYTLTETATVDDYVLLRNTYKVVCDANGLVSIVELEQDISGRYIIYNEPYHKLLLWKYDPINGESLSGAVFTLTGVSDYGTDVDLVFESLSSGMVIFEKLEPGDYILRETEAPANHVLLEKNEYIINIAKDGTVTGLEDFEYIDEIYAFAIPNSREYKGVITIVKRWRTPEGDVYSPTEGEILPIPTVHADTDEPEYELPTATIDKDKLRSALKNAHIFKKSNVRPSEDVRNNSFQIQTDDSDYPIYLWYDMSASMTGGGNIYLWWSDAPYVFLPSNCSYLFLGCTNLESVDLSGLNGTKVEYMHHMFSVATGNFYNSGKFKYINMSGIDTSNVKSMSWMFSGCQQLTTLILSESFDTSSVKYMSWMFAFCKQLTTLILPESFDTSRVESMDDMFFDCSGLTSLTLPESFDTSSVWNMSYMFTGCSGLTSLTLPERFVTSGVWDMSYMFCRCSGLEEIDVSRFVTSGVTNMSGMFSGCSSLTSLTLPESFDTSSVTNMSFMFNGCSGLEELDVSGFNTSSVKDMKYMFDGCGGFTSLTLPESFDTSSVTDMSYMFDGCSGLTSLTLPENFDTSSVKDMKYMFDGCSGFTSLTLPESFDTSSVTDMSYMFDGCSSLTSLTLSESFDTSGVTDMSYMFDGCSGITSLTLPESFDTSSVTGMRGMFSNCSGLTSLDLSGWNTCIVTDMRAMFANCYNLTTIYVSDLWSTEKVFYSDSGSMFSDCRSLVGGAGTVYNSSQTYKTYARIDGGTSKPGYFTYKAAPASGGGGSRPTMMLAAPARGLMLEAARIDLVTNSEMYEGEGDTSEVFDQWIDNGDGTWTYRFHVYDEESTYYIYEGALAGFESDHGVDNYIVLNYVPGGENTAVITNTKTDDEKGSLTIRKRVTGVSTSESFSFTIIFDDNSINLYGEDSDVKIGSGLGSFTLKHGESVTISNLPVGVGYTVTETDSKGYTASVNGTVGTELSSNITDTPVVTFVNHKDPPPHEPEPEFGSLKVTKRVELADGVELGKDEGRRYSFTVTLSGPEIPETAVNIGGRVFKNGKTSFSLGDGESVTIVNIPAGTHYEVSETTPEGFELTKEGDVGDIEKDVTAEAIFTNRKTQIDKYGGFTLVKELGKGSVGAETFTFYIELGGLEPNVTYTYGDGNTFSTPSGTIVLTVILSGGDSVTFDKLPIGSSYRITEAGNVYKAAYSIVNGSAEGRIVSRGAANTANWNDLATAVEEVEEGEEITVTFTNSGVTYPVNFAKLNETGEFLVGAVLRISDINGNEVETWETDGNLMTIDLPAGTFYLSEITAPEGYYPAEGSVEFTVSTSGKITSGGDTVYFVTITDKKTVVSIQKVDENNQPLAGAQLEVIEVAGIDEAGKPIEGAVVHMFTSKTEAEEITGVLVSGMKYILRETLAPATYSLAEDVIFTVGTSGVTEVTMSDPKTVVRIIKYKEDGATPLEGAVLQVLDGTTVVHEFTSATTAEVVTGVLVTGKTYKLHEVSSPSGYRVAADVEFTVSNDGTTEVTMTDEKIDDKTQALIIKVDEDGNAVIGAELQIIDDAGRVVYEFVSGEEAERVTGILVLGSSYILHEAKAPVGYEQAEDVSFTLDRNVEIKVKMVDKKKPEEPIRIEIQKVTPEGSELEGATLQIIDSEGTVIDEWVSTAEPHEITGLKAGEYTLKETAAPYGYQLANDIRFTVKEDGRVELNGEDVSRIEMEDPKEPDEPEPPKPDEPEEPEPPKPDEPEEIDEPENPFDNKNDTGDNDQTCIWLSLTVFSLFGLAVIVRKKVKE